MAADANPYTVPNARGLLKKTGTGAGSAVGEV